MKGISKTEHQKLVEALNWVKEKKIQHFLPDSDVAEAGEFGKELETVFGEYQHLMNMLEALVQSYEQLNVQAKRRFFGRKLNIRTITNLQTHQIDKQI